MSHASQFASNSVFLYNPKQMYQRFGVFYTIIICIAIFYTKNLIISGNAEKTLPATVISSITFERKADVVQSKTEVKTLESMMETIKDMPKPKPIERKPEKPVESKIQKKITEPQEKPAAKQEVSSPQASSSQSADVTSKPVTSASYKDKGNAVPKYPLMSYQIGEKGEVVLSYIVSEDGTPLDVKIEKSSGFIRLDNAALSQFSAWKFDPARNILGTIVKSSTQRVTFVFNSDFAEVKDAE